MTIKCLLCNKEFNRVSTNHLLAIHNITQQEYLKLFPLAPTISLELSLQFSKTHAEMRANETDQQKLERSEKRAKTIAKRPFEEFLVISKHCSEARLQRTPEEVAEASRKYSEHCASRTFKEFEEVGKRISDGINSRSFEERAETSKKLSLAQINSYAQKTEEEKTLHGNHISEAHAARSPEEKAETAKKNSQAQLANYATRTPEKWAELSKTLVEASASMSPEEKCAWRKSLSDASTAYYNSVSPEQEILRGNKISASQITRLATMSKEKRDLWRKHDSEAVTAYFASLTIEQKLEFAKSVSDGLNSRTLEQKAETSQKLVEAHNRWWNSLTDEQQAVHMRKSLTAMRHTQTFPEHLVEDFLNTRYPNTWYYNGQGQHKTVVGCRTPDFVHSTNKWVILVHGIYWHNLDNEKKDIEYYTKRGWKCIIVWEYDTASDETLEELVNFL